MSGLAQPLRAGRCASSPPEPSCSASPHSAVRPGLRAASSAYSAGLPNVGAGVNAAARRARRRLAAALLVLLPTLAVAVPAGAQTLPGVFWSSTKSGIAESAGTHQPLLQVQRASPAADLTVGYAISGTAACGTDYTIAGADCDAGTGSFTVPMGTSTFTEFKPITISITADDISDSGETVVLTLAAGTGYTVDEGALAAHTVTLFDDTGAAAFSLTGAPHVGGTLAAAKTKDDPDGNGTFSYVWQFRATPSAIWSPAAARSRGCATDAATCAPTHSTQHPTLGGEFRVAVSYTDGVGFLHFIFTNTVGPMTLPPPAGLTATAGDARVTLRWTDPGDDAITEYQYRQGSGSPLSWGAWTDIPSSDKDTTSHTVAGLANGTRYSFQVRAVAGAVEGAGSATASAAPVDPSTPGVFWSSSTHGIAESAGTHQPLLQVQRASPAADLTVGYAISGTAACGTDYTIAGADCDAGTGSFTVPMGTSTFTEFKPITISITADDISDSGETVVLTLAAGTGYTVDEGALAAHTVTLFDDTGAAAFSLTGAPHVGGTLAAAKTKDDPDGNGTFSYVWQFRATPSAIWSPAAARSRGCATDAATCAPTHSTQHPTLGGEFRVAVSYTDGVGFLHFIFTNTVGPMTLPPPSTVSISVDADANEGNAATPLADRLRTVTLSLDQAWPSAVPLGVCLSGTADVGTAAGDDYTPAAVDGTPGDELSVGSDGCLNTPIEIGAGATSATFVLRIAGDAAEELDETV
ncbi:MAG: fibronectin type III domain-containing protein, partial [Gammaproteobacteria bacterium]|nr:fibronectin type III domain-containing protein [Gammaproteobacteria bacterium]